jgi:hypothetical protein
MKKTTAFLAAIMMFGQVATAQNWSFVGQQGQGVNNVDDNYVVDMEVVSNQEIYTAMQVQTAFATSKRLEVYHYNGTTWTKLPNPSTDETFGTGVFIRKPANANVMLAYSRVNMSNATTQIVVKQFNGTSWDDVATPLSLQTGFVFSFAVSNAGSPIVIGANGGVLHTLVSGSWVAHTNTALGQVYNAPFYIDGQDRVVFARIESAVVGGQLTSRVHVDTFENGVFTTFKEQIPIENSSTIAMYRRINGHEIHAWKGVGTNLALQKIVLNGVQYTNTGTDTLATTAMFAYTLLENGGFLFAGNNPTGSAHLFNNGQSVLVYTSGGTWFPKKMKTSTDKVYMLHARGVEAHNLNTLGNVGSSVQEQNQLRLHVFPNPNNGLFTLRVPSLTIEERTTYAILNSMGQVVAQGKFEGDSLEISHELVPGLYHLTVVSGGMRSTKSLVIR